MLEVLGVSVVLVPVSWTYACNTESHWPVRINLALLAISFGIMLAADTMYWRLTTMTWLFGLLVHMLIFRAENNDSQKQEMAG